jgi:hypothetical protein
MSLLEEVVVRCTEIEQNLRALGATGSGLAELVESRVGVLKPETLSDIRKLASVRNRFVHEHGYTYPDSPTELLICADAVLVELRAILGQTIQSNHRSSLTRPAVLRVRDIPMEYPMPTSNPWVEIISSDSQPKFLRLRIPSTPTLRLVFFKGVFPEVPPLGKHAVPLLGVSKLARVSMGPAVTAFQLTATTRDQIEVALAIDVTAKVNPNDNAIARIASDANAGTSNELRLLETRIAHGLHSLVSQLQFVDLPDIGALQAKLSDLLTAPSELDIALSIVSLSVRSFAPTNPEIQTHQVDVLRLQKRAVLKIEEEAAERRRLEIERNNKAWEIRQQREAQEWEHAQAKLRAEDEDHLEQARHIRERELREMELQAQIRLAEIQRDAEIAKASRSSLEQVMPMIIKGAMGEGERRLLADIIKKQIGVSVGLTTMELSENAAPSPPPWPTPDAPTPQSSDDAPEK